MFYLFVFLTVLYGGVGLWTTFQAAVKMRVNLPASVLAGAVWPLFWLTGQEARNRKLGGGRRSLP